MTDRKLIPHTRMGKSGFGLTIAAGVFLAAAMAVALILNPEESGDAIEILGVLGTIIAVVTLIAISLSWLAIIHSKDRGLVFMAVTVAVTVLIVFFVGVEAIEAIASASTRP